MHKKEKNIQAHPSSNEKNKSKLLHKGRAGPVESKVTPKRNLCNIEVRRALIVLRTRNKVRRQERKGQATDKLTYAIVIGLIGLSIAGLVSLKTYNNKRWFIIRGREVENYLGDILLDLWPQSSWRGKRTSSERSKKEA